MRPLRVAAGCLNQTPLDWDGNTRRIREALGLARAQGVHVLCLPELAISGYGCEDAFHGEWVAQAAWECLQQLAPDSAGLLCCVGLPVRVRGALYNAAAVLVDGRLGGLVFKQHLAAEGIHYEPRWFRPWPAGQRIEHEGVPAGDLYFEVDGVRVGFEICEDAWVAARPGRHALTQELDLILNPSASHFALGKHAARTRLVTEGSRAFGVGYVYANLLGNEAGRTLYDGGGLIACGGKVVSAGPRLGFDDVQLTCADLDVTQIRNARARNPSLGTAPPAGAQPAVALQLRVAPGGSLAPAPLGARWEQGSDLKEEEFARAVALGLFDYLRKSRARGFVVSLSGGADSAAVAALVYLAWRLARAQLGDEGVAERLGGLTTGALQLTDLLHCVYQATENSSRGTRDAARALCEALGARFSELDVQPLVEAYVQRGESLVERPLSWDRDDLALQNIQARVRAPSVWLLANLTGSLLLTTSNRSEAAVGYATMDGDTCGGLAPVAGIDKAFLRHWLQWMQTTGLEGIGAVPALQVINAQRPTAELRPAAAGQTDEEDLMPYDVLDAIERAAIRDKRSPAECLRQLTAARPNVDAAQAKTWVRRFFTLWARNQWKRERYAPSFHLDDENLDPKSWCRFPILSGSFERELSAL